MKTVITNQKERVGLRVAEKIRRTAPSSAYQAIGQEEDGELIAGIVVDGIAKTNALIGLMQ